MTAVLVVAAAAVWPQPSEASPRPDIEPRSGTATFTDLTGGGACSLPGEPPNNLHVGISSLEYGAADVCGAYLDVEGPDGSVRVQITDHCRNCRAGLIDVTRKAFTQIADIDQGRAPVSYTLARNPPLASPISLRVKDGSSPWWFQIQVLDHGNALASVEMAVGPPGGPATDWRPLARSSDNFWTAANPGPGDGPFTLRITDIYGQNVTVYDVTLASDRIQHTVARLYQPPATPPRSPASTSTTDGAGRVASETTEQHPTATTGTGSDALVSLLIVLGALTIAVWLYLRHQPRLPRRGRRRSTRW